ncbi:MAG: hypothetical protein ABSB25_05920 [Sedimentisphaerales bacterium]|jgi:hypothetical protein
MVLKTKLSIGLGFLFAIIFALAFFCSYYVDKLSEEADSILKNNYDSIVYSKNMLSALDDTRTSISSTIFNPGDSKKLSDYYSHLFETSRTDFEKNLKAENNNITEIHEKDYVDTLNRDYAVYMNLCDKVKNGLGTTSMYFNEVLPCYEKLKQSILSIDDLNMEAVVRKNLITKQQSANVKTHMSVTAALCAILAFGYFWYFPFYVSNAVSYLSKRITELLRKAGIASDIKTNDETYIILQSIKLLEKKLGLDNPEKDSL